MSNDVTSWHPRWGIRVALDLDGDKQKNLAQRLGWPPSKLSLILSGEQRLTVDELSDIAREQGREIGWYFSPPFNGAMGVYVGWEQLDLAV